MRSRSPRLSLVIPTRNEASNVEALIAAICRAIPGPAKELVFVDDSDDATPLVLQRILAHADCPGLIVERLGGHRTGGLATAVARGFAISSGDFICSMDADLQHPASALPLLAEAAERERADVVVGSRYTRGRTGEGFDGMTRYLVSNAARVAAMRLIPQARYTTDPLSGFFLLRRSVVEGVRLQPIGYKILLEVLVRGRWKRLVDVPYAFHSRNDGVSKATLREGLKFARHLVRLREAERASESTPNRGRSAVLYPIAVEAAQPTNGRHAQNGHNGRNGDSHDEIPPMFRHTNGAAAINRHSKNGEHAKERVHDKR